MMKRQSDVYNQIGPIKKIFGFLRPIDLYLTLYLIVSLLFLTRFPFMHSDESWLSGLTRSMMHEGLGTTEYFFDLVPRYPHAIKIIFHLIQIAFISIFGYQLFSVRLISLIFGILCLYAFHALLRLRFKPLFSLLATIALSLDIQFLYASHFARQEIVILTVLVTCFYLFQKNSGDWSYRTDISLGILIGLSIGIHPNSFIIALSLGGLYLYGMLVKNGIRFRNLLLLIAIVTGFAAVFVALSFSFNPTFIPDYFNYGDDLGTTRGFVAKLFAFPKFYGRLFHMTNITYYTPLIKAQFIAFLFAAVVALALEFTRFSRNVMPALLMFIFINLGFLIIGRFAQPSIILIFPFGYLLLFLLAGSIQKINNWLAGGLIAAALLTSVTGVVPYLNSDYQDYIRNIRASVPQNAAVLANLNAEYAFDYPYLHDYRNLDLLDENAMTFSAYISGNEIAYIVYPQEMDYIYENRPVWNVLYGNLFDYYDDMQAFLNERCELTAEFDSPYAMRIVRYAYDQPWSVRVYRVIY